MFLQLGETYTPSIRITDSLGLPITTDNPIATIKNTQTNEYWNGFMWQNSVFNILLIHTAGGVYTARFTPDKTGVFQAICKSNQYSKTSTEIIEVLDSSIPTYSWPVNTSFDINFICNDTDLRAEAIITNDGNNTFWNGISWESVKSSVQLNKITEGAFTYSFIPDVAGKYSISVESESNKSFYIVEASDSGESIAPVIVNNHSLLTADGSDTTIITKNGLPLVGVQVSAFKSDTKELVINTVSDESGGWNLVLPPGSYFFIFEKSGYVSVGFEKAVR
jgi:hypothetical protein